MRTCNQYQELLCKGLGDQLDEHQELAEYLLAHYPTVQDFKVMSRGERKKLIGKYGVKLEHFFAAISLGQLVAKSHPLICGQAYSSQTLGRAMIEHFIDAERESVCVAYTNVHNDIIKFLTLFKGGQSECMLYPDQIFKLAFRYSASGLVVIHNHPTGDIQPSTQDLGLAKRLEAGSILLGIQLLDFLIIGYNDYYSWRENQK